MQFQCSCNYVRWQLYRSFRTFQDNVLMLPQVTLLHIVDGIFQLGDNTAHCPGTVTHFKFALVRTELNQSGLQAWGQPITHTCALNGCRMWQDNCDGW